PTRVVTGVQGPAAGGFWSMFRQNPRHTGRAGTVGPQSPVSARTFELGGLAYASPAPDLDGTAYVGAADRIVAVGADGSVRWVRPMADYVISSPAIGDNGLIYAGCRDGNVYALSATTGVVRWTFRSGDEVWSSPTVGPDGTVYV